MERRHVLAWFSVLGLSQVLRAEPAGPSEVVPSYQPSCLHPNGRWVALPGPKGDPIELWDVYTGQRAAVLPMASQSEDSPYPGGLGEAMATPRGQYSTFKGALFTGPSALVGAWRGYDDGFSWVVGLPGSTLAHRHLRASDSAPNKAFGALPRGVQDCLGSLSSEEVIWHRRRSLNASSQGDAWKVTQGETQAPMAELQFPGNFDPGAHPASRGAFSPSGNTVAFTQEGCHPLALSYDHLPTQAMARVHLWSWRSKNRPVPLEVGKGDISQIRPLDEKRWVVALHQHGISTRSLIPLGRTRLVELPSLKEFTPRITEAQSCQLGVDLQRGILVAQYGAGTVRCYELATRRMTRLMTAFMPHQGLLAWGCDSRHLLAARPLGPACLWDRQGHSTKELGCMDELIRPPVAELGDSTRCLAWSVELGLLLQGDQNGAIRAFQRSGLRFSPDRKTALHKPRPTPPVWQLPGDGHALRVLGVVGGEWLVGLEQEGRLKVWFLPQRRLHAQLQAHPLRANAMVIDWENHRIFTGGHDSVRSWSFPDLKPGIVMDTQGHWVSSLALRGTQLVVGSLDGVIRLFDADTGQPRWQIEAHGGWVGGLDFSPGGTLASGGEDCSVALWDPEKGGQLKRCQGAGNLPRWSPDGGVLAVYAHDRVKVLTPDLGFQDLERRHLKLDWGDDYT